MSDPIRPQRRARLYPSTVRGRFVVLDARAKQLVELHPEVTSLWPLLDGGHTLSELAELWEVTADVAVDDALETMRDVTDQLAAAGLLVPVEGAP